jgi:hypothetical protein
MLNKNNFLVRFRSVKYCYINGRDVRQVFEMEFSGEVGVGMSQQLLTAQIKTRS